MRESWGEGAGEQERHSGHLGRAPPVGECHRVLRQTLPGLFPQSRTYEGGVHGSLWTHARFSTRPRTLRRLGHPIFRLTLGHSSCATTPGQAKADVPLTSMPSQSPPTCRWAVTRVRIIGATKLWLVTSIGSARPLGNPVRFPYSQVFPTSIPSEFSKPTPAG